MQEVLQSIDSAYKNNKQKIEQDIFELALEGIANGRIDYQKDPILPYITKLLIKPWLVSVISPKKSKRSWWL
jgi:hypothetical protein